MWASASITFSTTLFAQLTTEEVTLSLDEVGGEGLGSVTVKEGQGGGERWDGDTPEGRLSDNSSPSGLGLGDGLEEEGADEQVFELRVLSVGGGNVGKEDRLDDTSTSPHGSDTSVVEGPVVDLGGLSHEHESLSIRDDLGGVKSLFEVIDELLLVALEGVSSRGGDELGSSGSLLLEGRKTSGKDGLTDEGDGHTLVEGVNGGPLSGTLLSGGVENLLNHGSTVSVVESEDISGNLDQERVEDTILPLYVSDHSSLLSVLPTLEKISAISFSSRPRPRLRIS